MSRVNRCVAIAQFLIVFCLSSSLALADKKYGPGVTDTEIKIGQTYPYSGPLSAYATIARTEAAIFARLNSEGGINGRKINFISLDDGYNPAKTVEQTRRLIEQEQVLLMFNPLGTPTSLAVIGYLNQRHIPHLFLSTGASVFGDYRAHPWTMGLQPNPAKGLNVYAQIATGALIQVLKQCGDDLTRENVMRQAENLRDVAAPLLLPGIKINTGPSDHYPVQQVQLIRFDGQKWERFGDLLSE